MAYEDSKLVKVIEELTKILSEMKTIQEVLILIKGKKTNLRIEKKNDSKTKIR